MANVESLLAKKWNCFSCLGSGKVYYHPEGICTTCGGTGEHPLAAALHTEQMARQRAEAEAERLLEALIKERSDHRWHIVMIPPGPNFVPTYEMDEKWPTLAQPQTARDGQRWLEEMIGVPVVVDPSVEPGTFELRTTEGA